MRTRCSTAPPPPCRPRLTRHDLPRRLAPFLSGGFSILASGRDGALVSSVTRACGLTVVNDREVVVYLPEATAAATIAAFEDNGAAAVVVNKPTTHASLQIKGTAREIRRAQESERAVVDGYVRAFAGELEHAGLPERVTRRLTCWPAWAVRIEVDALFDQTPGPQAGLPLP